MNRLSIGHERKKELKKPLVNSLKNCKNNRGPMKIFIVSHFIFILFLTLKSFENINIHH